MNANRLVQIKARLGASIPGYQDPMAILDIRELVNLIETLRNLARAEKRYIDWAIRQDITIENVNQPEVDDHVQTVVEALNALPAWVLED